MPSPVIGQITISFDGATLRAEAPGRNGSRQKITDISFSDLPFSLRENLISQIETIKDRNKAELIKTQNANIQKTAENHNIGFARKIWGNDWIFSRTMRARVAKAGQYDPISGKIKSSDKNSEKEILELDL